MQLPIDFGASASHGSMARPGDGYVPLARKTDPVTSQLAAAEAEEFQNQHFRVILWALDKYGPLGKDGIASRTRLTGVAVARRCTELNRAGLIKPTGRTVASTAGRKEREWEKA